MTRRTELNVSNRRARRGDVGGRRVVARSAPSARLVYRSLGASGEPYPEWVRALHGQSGVYVIKAVDLFGSTIVYVGESHSGRLYETMTRHFQGWKRRKSVKWYQGFFTPSENDPGTTYDREACEVAVRIASVARALDVQAELIRKLKPRDNVLESVPF